MTAIDIPMDGGDPPMPEHPVFSPNQSFDKALENFKEDPKELRRRKKEARKLGVDPDVYKRQGSQPLKSPIRAMESAPGAHSR